MNGKTLGHYRVGEQLGRGGMGEVCVADDVNLNRKVALKFLPDAFTGDPERMARFEREAKILASLNHSNIAAIYGLEQADGKRFIVMELVEGETLAQRLSKGRIPVDEALGICKQITEGLEAAHEKGVIHRDLKPANVMITEGNKVKVLDFGLAKALSDEAQGVDTSQSPTLTEAMTRPGVILGTAAYMSPEQAKGKSVDKRADIWAFGCILYECLTGKRAFEGETVTETLASILKGEPDWQALPEQIPSAVRVMLRRCLQRDLSSRLHDAGDALIEINEASTSPVSETAGRSRISRTLAAILVSAGLVAGGGLAYLWQRWNGDLAPKPRPRVMHIAAPAEAISAFHHGFALSPDGETLVFSARTADGRRQLWERRLGELHSKPISGTNSGIHPFWSPDGRQIAFYAEGELRRIPAGGGQVQTICPALGYFKFGSWGGNDGILFSLDQGTGGSIFRVPAHGGSPAAVPGLGSGDFSNPQWLPGNLNFLFCRVGENRSAGIYAAAVDGSVTPKLVVEMNLLAGDRGFSVSPPGNLFFNKSGALCFQTFDPKSLSMIGQSTAISGPAGTPMNWFTVAASNDQVAMLARESRDDTGDPGDPLSRLKWFDRRGEAVGDLGPPGRYWTLRLSPDGLRAAVNPDDDIWILEGGNRRTRVTSRPETEYFPVWTPDGSKIAFLVDYAKIPIKISGIGGPETDLPNTTSGFFPTDWSRDGKYLLLTARTRRESVSYDIWLYDYGAKSAAPLLATNFDASQARFSPDGKWFAYSSNADGRLQVYIRPFKREGGAILVSQEGGSYPAWRGDGSELFYLSPSDELISVSVHNVQGGLQIGESRRLFRIPINDIASAISYPYDVTPDGQRFLVNVPEPPEPLVFIQGFEEFLKRLH